MSETLVGCNICIREAMQRGMPKAEAIEDNQIPKSEAYLSLGHFWRCERHKGK